MSKRGRALQQIKQKRETKRKPLSDEDENSEMFDDLVRSVQDNKLIPIIGDTVRHEHIFDVDFDQHVGADDEEDSATEVDDGATEDAAEDDEAPDEQTSDSGLLVMEELAEMWADEIKFPMPDKHAIARVAQYCYLEKGSAYQAKVSFLDFQKKTLLDVVDALAEAEGNRRLSSLVARLRSNVTTSGFGDIVSQVGFPRFPPGREDPLRILAKLPLSIYITTGYYDFMERALRAEDKDPKTRICCWNLEDANLREEHRSDLSYTPSPEQPLVYHLYGLEQYPRSLVLSEDDYLDFLVRVTEQPSDDSGKRVIPSFLQAALKDSALVLLGYRLYDWDFRVLFRGFINNADKSDIEQRSPGVAIQLEPNRQKGIDGERARIYLSEYFWEKANFNVFWGKPDEFIKALWSAYR